MLKLDSLKLLLALSVTLLGFQSGCVEGEPCEDELCEESCGHELCEESCDDDSCADLDELEEADEPTSEAQGIVYGKPVYEHCLYSLVGGLAQPKYVRNHNQAITYGTTPLVSDMVGWMAQDGHCFLI